MKNLSPKTLGTGCVSVFVLGSALRDVYLGSVFQSVSVFVVLAVAFGLTATAGLAVALTRGDSLAFLLSRPLDTLFMNVATAGAWTCYFIALKNLDPSVVNTLFAGIGAFAIIALRFCCLPISAPYPTTPLQKGLQLGLIATLIALVVSVATGHSGYQRADLLLSLGSGALALIAGILITVGHLYAKRLNEDGSSSAAILGTRFFALLAVAAVGQGVPSAMTVTLPDLAYIVSASMLLIAIPVFFNQYGMALIDPFNARVITAAGPALVFVLQQFDPRITWSPATFVCILFYSGFVIAANTAPGHPSARASQSSAKAPSRRSD